MPALLQDIALSVPCVPLHGPRVHLHGLRLKYKCTDWVDLEATNEETYLDLQEWKVSQLTLCLHVYTFMDVHLWMTVEELESNSLI